jgi:hypothetical protein
VVWGVAPRPRGRRAGGRHLHWLKRERTPAPDNLVRAVAYLDELARNWPPADPAPALERGRRATMIVEHHRVAGKSSPPCAGRLGRPAGRRLKSGAKSRAT